MNWTYDGEDPALMLWTAAMYRFPFTIAPGSCVAELGCCESPFIEYVTAADPTLDVCGVDTRTDAWRNGLTRVGNALDVELFPGASLDWVVMLGALEHFGLGYYGDPVHGQGDTIAMQNVLHWLKPGGFVYFDVPCQPSFRISPDRCFRQYSPASVSERLLGAAHSSGGRAIRLREIRRGYSLPEPHAGTWCAEPQTDRNPYWFCAVLAQKVDG